MELLGISRGLWKKLTIKVGCGGRVMGEGREQNQTYPCPKAIPKMHFFFFFFFLAPMLMKEPFLLRPAISLCFPVLGGDVLGMLKCIAVIFVF